MTMHRLHKMFTVDRVQHLHLALYPPHHPRFARGSGRTQVQHHRFTGASRSRRRHVLPTRRACALPPRRAYVTPLRAEMAAGRRRLGRPEPGAGRASGAELTRPSALGTISGRPFGTVS